MRSKEFRSRNGYQLVVKHRKHAVILEMNVGQLNDDTRVQFKFKKGEMINLIEYLEDISKGAWKNFEPKEANSVGSDYFEYYDRELDNNGYMRIREYGMDIERPYKESNKLYQFNKPKMESFLYDFRGMLKELQD